MDAYAELVRRYQDQALAAAFFILGDRAEAEDATQEAFTRAFAALERFRPDGSFRAWLLRIVANEAHDLRSAAQRRADLLSRASVQLPSASPPPSAEAAAFAEQRREAVLRALFELREDDRMVITYRYFFDLSEAEMADILGVARGTIKSRLARAIARLRPILRRLGPLVVVGPGLEAALGHLLPRLSGPAGPLQPAPHLAQAVVQQLGAGGAGSGASPAPAAVRGNGLSQSVPTLVGMTALGLLAAAFALVTAPDSARMDRAAPPSVTAVSPAPAAAASPAVPAPPALPGPTVVYGGDLSAADRQAVAALLGSDGTASVESVSHQELVDTLRQQGMAVSEADQAISSAHLVCQAPGAGIAIQTHGISGLPAPVYAAALLTAGLSDADVAVAAPPDRSVSGEAALVGALKAAPRCSAQGQLDPQRAALAYQQLTVTAALAAGQTDPTRASAVLLSVLHAVIVGQATDAGAIESALQTAATEQGLPLDASQRAAVVELMQRLAGRDYGEYAHGYRLDELGPNQVRLTPADAD